MGKKKKRRPAQNRPKKSKQSAPERKTRSKYPIIALAVGVILLAAGTYFLSQGKKSSKVPSGVAELKKENIRLRETRATLSPFQFSGKVRRAYEIAREIPEVLDRLFCYCRCRENSGHLNLLSCYVGTHAST